MIFTIGHSTHPQLNFADLLHRHNVEVVADVRSQPYSRFHAQFNREELRHFLQQQGISYLFLGDELGARSKDPSCYSNGKVQYDRLVRTTDFQVGISQLDNASRISRLALMCAEREPLECHRTLLIARHLFDRGWNVCHIHADGSLEDHAAAEERLMAQLRIPTMFLSPEERREEAYRVQTDAVAYTLPEDSPMIEDRWRSAAS